MENFKYQASIATNRCQIYGRNLQSTRTALSIPPSKVNNPHGTLGRYENKSPIQLKFEVISDGDKDSSQGNQQVDLLASVRRVAYLRQKGADAFFELGKELIKVKQNIQHGWWLRFLKMVDMSQPTAWRYMNFAKEVRKAQIKDSKYSPANVFDGDKFWQHQLQKREDAQIKLQQWLELNSGLGLVNEVKAMKRKLQRLLAPVKDMTSKFYEHAPAEVVDSLNQVLASIYTLAEIVLTRGSKRQVCAMCGRERDGNRPDGWMIAPLAVESLCPHCQPIKEMNLLMSLGYLPEKWEKMKAESQAGEMQ